MSAPPRRVEFRYGHSVFVQRALLLLGIWVASTVLLVSFAGVEAVWIVLASAAIGAYAVVFGLSPLMTRHWLTRSRLILRQGWYFRAILPLRELRAIVTYDGDAKVGLRGDLSRRTLYVTGSKVGLVAAELRSPRRFWQVLFASADRVVFDVDGRDRFLGEVAARRALLTPVEANRPDAELRD